MKEDFSMNTLFGVNDKCSEIKKENFSMRRLLGIYDNCLEINIKR